MVSVERGMAIAELPEEGELRTEYDTQIGFKDEIEREQRENNHQEVGKVQNSDWPKNATIEFRDFTMKYRTGLEPVLKNLTFKIENAQKVGIVGRTGAGKSSIIQALFRMVVAEPGSVLYVGDCDAQQMGLHSLRKNLSIIPQTPFLFKGSIRENIDPFSEYSDQRLWTVLKESDLHDFIQ